MRIAHVITRMILGGAQENTLLSCEGSRRRGAEVLLVTGPAIGPEGSLIERGRAGGVPIEIVPELRRAIHPWQDWRAYRRIKQVLREFRPDVVHTHSAKGGVLGRAAASALGVPAIVHTVHGAPFHPYQSAAAREFARRCERWAARRCHALVSVSDAMTELMVSASVAPREQFTTIYSGLEVEPFLAAESLRPATRAELGYGTEHFVIGKIARLFDLKGHEDLVRAAPAIVAACPNARFLLIGDGALRERIESEVAAAGLSDRFKFVGLVPPERIPALLAAMDVVVHLSLREGLARALVQALLVGRPVVSYDIDGAREVVIPGKTGFLAQPESVADVVTYVNRLAADPSLRARLGSAGRQFADRFRANRMVDELHKVYKRVLGERQTSPKR